MGRRYEADAADDDTLLERYRSTGDPGALHQLIDRHRGFARLKARSYFLTGGDRDDVEQEALIGLFKAVRDYRPGHAASFRAFAELCMKRQIITAIKAATRLKHGPLNAYVSFAAGSDGDADGAELGEALVDRREIDPCQAMVDAERAGSLQATVDARLTALEVDVLTHYLEGRTYLEIGELVGRHAKSVDNAVQRIKRKLALRECESTLAHVA